MNAIDLLIVVATAFASGVAVGYILFKQNKYDVRLKRMEADLVKQGASE